MYWTSPDPCRSRRRSSLISDPRLTVVMPSTTPRRPVTCHDVSRRRRPATSQQLVRFPPPRNNPKTVQARPNRKPRHLSARSHMPLHLSRMTLRSPDLRPSRKHPVPLLRAPPRARAFSRGSPRGWGPRRRKSDRSTDRRRLHRTYPTSDTTSVDFPFADSSASHL